MTQHFSKDESLLNDLFKLAMPVQSNAAEKVKIMHLDHVLASKGKSWRNLHPCCYMSELGPSACRLLYQKLSVTPPFSLELHKRMIEVEIQQSRIDAKQIRKCYEMACDQFGLKNPGILITTMGVARFNIQLRATADLWMDYVKFELTHGSKPLITGIYSRASKTLDSAHSETFMQMYANLQTSIL